MMSYMPTTEEITRVARASSTITLHASSSLPLIPLPPPSMRTTSESSTWRTVSRRDFSNPPAAPGLPYGPPMMGLASGKNVCTFVEPYSLELRLYTITSVRTSIQPHGSFTMMCFSYTYRLQLQIRLDCYYTFLLLGYHTAVCKSADCRYWRGVRVYEYRASININGI